MLHLIRASIRAQREGTRMPEMGSVSIEVVPSIEGFKRKLAEQLRDLADELDPQGDHDA